MIERWHTVFDFKEPLVLKENSEYGFSILQVRPQNQPFQLLLTSGLSNYLQPVTERSKAYERIELYFCLPEYWDLAIKSWPVEWLNRIAMVPQKNKTWFGPGDTLPAGRPPQFVDDKLQANHFILSPPILLQERWRKIETLAPAIQVLAIIPVFQREFDYKSQNSGTLLLEKFRTKKVDEMVDVYRQPVARRRFMGMF